MDRTVAHRSLQVATGGDNQAHSQAHKTDRSCGPSALCKTPPPVVPEVDSGVPPDSQTETDGLDTPDMETQSLPGMDQDSQSWGDTESQSQSQSASGSGRPVRIRRRPTALDEYILE